MAAPGHRRVVRQGHRRVGWQGAGDRFALVTIGGLGTGVLLAGLGPLVGRSVGLLGHGIVALSALGVGYLLLATMAHHGGP